MDQSSYVPNLRDQRYEPPSPELASDPNRPTIVHRLPPAIPTPEPEKEITNGRLLFHLLLLGLTVLTTTGIGVLWFYSDQSSNNMARGLAKGVVYSFTIITILAAHEMGHYIACRWYGVNATLPYFIPVPLPPVGTFGAFIKIKSPIPTRRALFDIGIAGPLAGFAFALPAAFVAHYFAVADLTAAEGGGVLFIHPPLLFQFFERILHLPQNIEANPVWWATWVGVFMTSLNLVPVGQLDGGHVTFAVFGPRGHRVVALICYAAVICLALYSGFFNHTWTWVVYGLILTLMLRVGHPPVIDDSEPLGFGRKLIAIIGLLVFILSFIPVPFSFD
jgi:membrane-associated protease RseP (regulator of RpoE activity)